MSHFNDILWSGVAFGVSPALVQQQSNMTMIMTVIDSFYDTTLM